MLVTALLLVPSMRRASDSAAEAAVSPYLPLYFEANGQTTSGPFLAYWMTRPYIGEPVSQIVMHNGHWTQWFEFARLELHDVPFDVATGADITQTRIGVVFSDGVGHSAQLEAFVPKTSGPERFFPDTGHSIANGFRLAYEQPGVPERLGPPISDEFSIGEAVYQFFEFGAFSWTHDGGVVPVAVGLLDAGLNGQVGVWQGQPDGAIDVAEVRALADTSAWDEVDLPDAFAILAGVSTGTPDISDAGLEFNQLELAEVLPGERWIEVDLSDFTTTAWVGDIPVFRTLVVTGHPNSPTPIGEFSIYLRYEQQTMSGTLWDGTPYYQEDVPWVMYFVEDYAIHGTTWRTDFGFAGSPGCPTASAAAAQALYDFSDYGTRVVVHE
jgi:hypothetical protein